MKPDSSACSGIVWHAWQRAEPETLIHLMRQAACTYLGWHAVEGKASHSMSGTLGVHGTPAGPMTQPAKKNGIGCMNCAANHSPHGPAALAGSN